MVKAGLIGSLVGFIYMMSLTLLSPFCTLCFTPVLGIGTGYVAGWFDKPAKVESSLSRGTVAGILTGIGVLAGQILAAVVNGVLVTNSEQLPRLMQDIGLSDFVITNPNEYWQATLTVTSFCGIFNLALIAGLGALGGAIWFQTRRSTPPSNTPV